MQEVMTMIAVRQGLLPPEETEQQGGTLSAKRAVRSRTGASPSPFEPAPGKGLSDRHRAFPQLH